MLDTLLIGLLKLIAGLVIFYFLVLAVLHIRALKKLRYYESQGAVVFPGARRFFFGNSLDFQAYAKARSGAEVVAGPQAWLIFKHFPSLMGHQASYKAEQSHCENYPIVALNLQSRTALWVADPDIAQDVFITKNAHLDKTVESFLLFKCIIGQSFIFSPNDETWKIKRKAMAHAFYKDRLQHMLETLKSFLISTFTRWAEQIDKNGGSHEVNMASEFSDILARNIIHICFGEDLSDTLIEL